MIILTRLGGHELALNPDLMERAEPTPDTVITMVDGHKIVVAESLDEVVSRVRTWRASVAAEAYTLAGATHDAFATFGELAAEDATAHTAGPARQARILRLQPRGE